MDGKIEGRVISARTSFYDVDIGTNVLRCQLRGIVKRKLRSEIGKQIYSDPIAVGDKVLVAPIDDEEGSIEALLPRCNKLSRRDPNRHRRIEQIIVSNVDQAIIVGSIHSPELNCRFIDRFLILVATGKIDAVICINKVDLLNESEQDKFSEVFQAYEDLGYQVILTSIHRQETIDQLRSILKGKLSVIVGTSGVGKSSLLNAVQPNLGLRTHEVSSKTRKGRHTTTLVELFDLEIGGKVADTPGVREVGLWGVNPDYLDRYFPEIGSRIDACKFSDCSHSREPNCAIIEAVEKGEIAAFRYESYLALLGENN